MIAECEMFVHMNNIGHVVAVGLAEMIENSDFFLRLSVKPLLVTDHLECDVRLTFVVENSDDLSETTLPDHLECLVPIGNVVMWYLQQTKTIGLERYNAIHMDKHAVHC